MFWKDGNRHVRSEMSWKTVCKNVKRSHFDSSSLSQLKSIPQTLGTCRCAPCVSARWVWTPGPVSHSCTQTQQCAISAFLSLDASDRPHPIEGGWNVLLKANCQSEWNQHVLINSEHGCGGTVRESLFNLVFHQWFDIKIRLRISYSKFVISVFKQISSPARKPTLAIRCDTGCLWRMRNIV